MLQIKRIHELPEENDGLRVLIDRLWPQGVLKSRACLGARLKDMAPSTELRRWFGHKAENMEKFTSLYRAELDANPKAQEEIQYLIEQSKQGTVTLLYAAVDPEINHAIILKKYIEEKMEEE